METRTEKQSEVSILTLQLKEEPRVKMQYIKPESEPTCHCHGPKGSVNSSGTHVKVEPVGDDCCTEIKHLCDDQDLVEIKTEQSGDIFCSQSGRTNVEQCCLSHSPGCDDTIDSTTLVSQDTAACTKTDPDHKVKLQQCVCMTVQARFIKTESEQTPLHLKGSPKKSATFPAIRHISYTPVKGIKEEELGTWDGCMMSQGEDLSGEVYIQQSSEQKNEDCGGFQNSLPHRHNVETGKDLECHRCNLSKCETHNMLIQSDTVVTEPYTKMYSKNKQTLVTMVTEHSIVSLRNESDVISKPSDVADKFKENSSNTNDLDLVKEVAINDLEESDDETDDYETTNDPNLLKKEGQIRTDCHEENNGEVEDCKTTTETDKLSENEQLSAFAADISTSPSDLGFKGSNRYLIQPEIVKYSNEESKLITSDPCGYHGNTSDPYGYHGNISNPQVKDKEKLHILCSGLSREYKTKGRNHFNKKSKNATERNMFQCYVVLPFCMEASKLAQSRAEEGRRNVIYTCFICQKLFFHRKSLAEHIIKVHTEEKPFTCDICEKQFAFMVDLKGHVFHVHKKLESISKKRFRCAVCEKHFKNKHEMQAHLRIHTGEKPYKCQFCEKRFVQSSQCNVHIRIHTGEKPYKCDVCECKFRHSSHLYQHRQRHFEAPQRSHKCEVCQMWFYTAAYLKQHMKTHSVEKPHQCSVCSKKFSRRDNLESHLRIHTGEKAFKCDICGQAFRHRNTLKFHMRWHSGEKPYKCDVCDKRFRQSIHLKKHLQSHSGEKPYECDVCKKCFASTRGLSVHTMTHTGEKPYKCSVCEQLFRTSGHLKGHMRTHTGEKPYKCDFCDKRFAFIGGLTTHKRIHTGEKPYKCKLCESSFNRLDNLKKHMKKEHNKK